AVPVVVAVEDPGVVLLAGVAVLLAVAGSGAERLMMTAAGSPLRPLMTKNAGWRSLAPPTGISETARCLPGVRCMRCGAAAVGRAIACGARTALTSPPSVPRSLAAIALYWPAGHSASAVAASARTAPTTTRTRRPG